MDQMNEKPSNEVSDIERLVELRFLFEIALRQALDTSIVGRHAATILLDGVNELAMTLAITNRGESIPYGFSELVKKSRSIYQNLWEAPGRKGIEELHRARNLVQHYGVSTDPTNLPRWTADTERFVRSLVDAAFKMELRNVVRSDAVTDRVIRYHLRAAEEALSAPDAAQALESALEAHRIATSKWRSQWQDADPTKFHSTLSGGLQDDGAREQLQRLTLYTEVLPFSLDLGEFVWLRSLERAMNADVPVEVSEAERALSFVFAWILRWEAFSFSYTEHRIRRWREGLHPPITGNDRPTRVIGVEVEHGYFKRGDSPRFVVQLLVADPPIDDSEKWRKALEVTTRARWNQALGEDQGGAEVAGLVHVSNEGTVTFQQVTQAQTRLIPDVVKIAVPEAVHAIQAGADAESKWEAEAKELESDYKTALSAILGGDDRLVDDLAVTTGRLTTPDKWLQIVLADHLGKQVQADTFKTLQEKLGSNSLYNVDNRTFEFREPPPPDEILEIITEAIEVATQVSDEERRAQEQLDRVRDEIRKEVTSIVRDVEE